MTRARITWAGIVAGWLFVGPVCLPLSAGEPGRLEQLLREASRHRVAELVGWEQPQAIENLMVRTLLHREDPRHLAADWRPHGWALHVVRERGRETWLLREAPGQATGRGFYAFRPDQQPVLLLQAPHSFADKYTRQLARQLFAEGPFLAAGWNTVRRQQVDAAHKQQHTFSLFTCAAVSAFPQIYVVQLHGFSTEKRETAPGRAADLILSNGSPFPNRGFRQAARQFAEHFPTEQISLYPTQVQELGATTNAQAKLLRQMGSDRFLHLELSEPFRKRL